MAEEKSGIEKAREVAAKLKSETEEKQQASDAKMAEVKGELVAMNQNSELAKMYQESANVGSLNLQGALPQLKVHATGKSSKNELSDGTEPGDGNFFYSPTKEEFDGLNVHILTVSKGFRAEGFEGKQNVFNQIVGGCIIGEDSSFKPFIMYMTGIKLSYLWEFGKEASQYTHAKPIPIPMFALTVKLTTEKVTHNYGKSWVVKFEIVRTEDKNPEIILDPKVFSYLKDSVAKLEDTISSLVETKTKEDGAESVEVEDRPF